MYFIPSKKFRVLVKNSTKTSLEFFDLYRIKVTKQNLTLYISRKKATKATHIHCTESGDIIWEQFYPFGGMSRPSREKKYVLKPERDKNAITVIVIRGNPGNIIGLENGIFNSHLCEPKKNNIYLMTEKNAIDYLGSI